MKNTRFPTVFVSHGGGPWPWVENMRGLFATTTSELTRLASTLLRKPRAVLMITGHWESDEFTVSTAEHPPMEYDYTGFPEHTYHIQYPAPGSPAIAARVQQLLAVDGIASRVDPQRGFDHGTFVPLSLMYPDADVPVVLVSMKSTYDAAEHIRLGEALAPLRDEDVLIMGSGLTYHNMRGFGNSNSEPVARSFERYLNTAISQANAAKRNQMLVDWQSGPGARLAHPREDHFDSLDGRCGRCRQRRRAPHFHGPRHAR